MTKRDDGGRAARGARAQRPGEFLPARQNRDTHSLPIRRAPPLHVTTVLGFFCGPGGQCTVANDMVAWRSAMGGAESNAASRMRSCPFPWRLSPPEIRCRLPALVFSKVLVFIKLADVHRLRICFSRIPTSSPTLIVTCSLVVA